MSHAALLDLSRWQRAVTAAMHTTLPALTVGTAMLPVVGNAMYILTKRPLVVAHVAANSPPGSASTSAAWAGAAPTANHAIYVMSDHPAAP